MLRSDQSNVLENALGLPLIKKASYFERVCFGAKEDPFKEEQTIEQDIWKVNGNQLLRKKSKYD